MNWPTAFPAQPTPLIGREQELQALRQQLSRADVRLLTLTGAAGIGKTSLALAVAADPPYGFADGVCFVDLAPLAGPRLVIPAIAQALRMEGAMGRPTAAGLGRDLRDRQLLLVLDHCEHVAAAGPQVADLLARCPRLKVLATKREALRLPGEQVLPLLPLSRPPLDPLPGLESIASYPAVGLFVRRARAVEPDFVLCAADAAAVAAICARLDGIPLALELVAAWSDVLRPRDMLLEALRRSLDRPRAASGLGDSWAALRQGRLDLWQANARERSARRRMVRTVVEWSYDLLKPDERWLLQHLTVFESGIPPQAVAAVGEAGRPGSDVQRGLAALVRRGLLWVEAPAADEPWPRMPPPVREYGEERLEASGEAELARSRLARFYASNAERGLRGRLGQHETQEMGRTEQEQDNCPAALRRMPEKGGTRAAAQRLASPG